MAIKLKRFSNGNKWVAVEVTTESWYDRKATTSTRVVSEDAYNKMRRDRVTSKGTPILSITALSHPTSKEDASTYISHDTKPRKTPIDKRDADYVVHVINIGKLRASGDTAFDWNLWDDRMSRESVLYALGRYSRTQHFLLGRKGSLSKGDKVILVDNDSERIVNGGSVSVVEGILPCNKDKFVSEYRRLFPRECKEPSVSFGRELDGIPWKNFSSVYSIKGVTE